VTRDTTFKVKDRGHQAALLSTTLTHKAAAAVTVGTHLACESTAMLHLLGGTCVRHLGAHGEEERWGHIVSPHAQLVM